MQRIFTWFFVSFYCLISLTHFIQAQESTEINYGIKGGLNFAELYGADANPESDFKTGYSLGLFAKKPLSTKLSVQAELIWSLQGEKTNKKARYNISYLNIPVVVKHTFSDVYVEGGLQLGLQTISTYNNVPQNEQFNNLETFDFSLLAGIGIQVFEDAAIGVRYCHGLTNLIDQKSLKNSVIYIGLSYKLF